MMNETGRRRCEAPPITPRHPVRVACVFEQAIGHVTFQANLSAQMAGWPDVAPTWHGLAYSSAKRWPPPKLNWTLRSGLMAREALRNVEYEALFFHTHLPALLCPDHMRRVPTLLSMDATPAQNARLGIYVGGSQRRALARRLSGQWVSWGIRKAYRIVAWSEWVRQSLVNEYGLKPEQVAVLPPGIDVGRWSAGTGAEYRVLGKTQREGLPRILFVGGDLRDKGGYLLLNNFRQHWRGRAELHLVTRTPLPAEPGVFVHNGLTPNAPELMRLYRGADLFVLPTFGDTFAQVILEAMASGLPVIASDVGAISELVSHGETGLLVAARDGHSLFAAVEALLQDPELGRRMGRAGYERARECFDIARNGRRLVNLLHEACEGRR